MTAETDIAAIDDGGENTAAEVRTALTSVLSRADWIQDIDESGTSFTNWTGDAGTWASNGTIIQQTNTSSSEFKAHYTTLKPTGAVVFQADVRIPTAGTNLYGGLVFPDESASTTGAIRFTLERVSGTYTANLVHTGVTAFSANSYSWSVDTWYTLRLVKFGMHFDAYIDGTFLNSGFAQPPDNEFSRFGLYAFGCAVDFRNIKTWNKGQLP